MSKFVTSNRDYVNFKFELWVVDIGLTISFILVFKIEYVNLRIIRCLVEDDIKVMFGGVCGYGGGKRKFYWRESWGVGLAQAFLKLC